MRPVLLPVAALLLCASPVAAAPDWSAVDAAFGRAGAEQPGGVHRYSFPRSDLTVTLDGVVLKPALALGSWAAFHDMGDRTEVMGDLVLRQEEVNPVLSRLLASGLTITALHNHLLRSTPATIYMHIHGEGDPARLAAVVRSALALTGTPLGPQPPAAAGPPLAFDTAAIDAAMGAKGKVAGGVYQFSLPRAEQITEAGMPVPPSMGLATAVNFQASGAGRAAITGDFVLIESEVAPVLKALRDSGIDVTALHNHLGQEQPRLFFMHFWANADAVSLARGIRHALDRTNLARATH